MIRRLTSTALRTARAAEASRASFSLLAAIDDEASPSPASVSAACRRRSSFSTSTLTSSSTSTSFSSLPVIDVDALLSASSTPEERLETAKKLHRACKEVGFFYAKARGTTDSSASSKLLSKARRWFEETPLAEKRKIALSAATGYRGWQPLHANVTRYPSQEEGGAGEGISKAVSDHHEAIDIYRGVSPSDGLPPSPVHAPPGTGFPTESDPALSKELEAHIAKCLKLGQAIMRGLALGLGLGDERFFEREENGGTTAESSYWVSRVIFYPPMVLEGEKKGDGIPRGERLSCGEHTDYGWLTMITATSSGDATSEDALQVRNARGEYVSAPPLPDAFICNVGDMLHIASGGVYASTPHRVVHAAFRGEGEGKGEGETALPPPRTSVAVFYEPHFNARIEPAAVASSGAKSVDAKHYGAHLEAKVLSNFEL